MSSSPTTSVPSTPTEPAYQLVSYQKSLLDALFVTKDRRVPKFATISNDRVTTLYAVSGERDLQMVAQIAWEANGQQKHSITVRGCTLDSDVFLPRSKSFLGEATWALKCNDMTYKWRIEGHGDDFVNASIVGLRCWSCYETALPPSFRPPSSSVVPVATLFPPQLGAVASAATELVVQERARQVADVLICSAIVLASHKSQWRTASSRHTKETLEHILKSEFTGSLPPYMRDAPEGAAAGARRRDSASAPRRYSHRRPRTAHGTGSGSGSRSVPAFGRAIDIRTSAHAAGELMMAEPPPYSSRDDLNLTQDNA